MMIAGPCAIESQQQLDVIAQELVAEKVVVLRGGIYKMRTLPDSFQGLGKEAMEWVRSIKKKHHLKFVSEVTDPRQIEFLVDVVDYFQVGTRNMFNYELLKDLSYLRVPVILKRGFAALVKEWLAAGEYLVKGGNEQVILCERGIRTFETSTRNTLDLTGALFAQKESNWPVIIDPSHATGCAEFVTPVALATVAAGLDGLMVEVHPSPKDALSDGKQSLDFVQFRQMMKQLKVLLSTLNRELA